MFNPSASLAMSTSILEALPGKLDIKRHSPSILYVYGYEKTVLNRKHSKSRSVRSHLIKLHTVFHLIENVCLLQIRKFSRGFYFRETSHMQSFVKIKSSRNVEITLSFTDMIKACPSCEF